jgi:hypothetical protein
MHRPAEHVRSCQVSSGFVGAPTNPSDDLKTIWTICRPQAVSLLDDGTSISNRASRVRNVPAKAPALSAWTDVNPNRSIQTDRELPRHHDDRCARNNIPQAASFLNRQTCTQGTAQISARPFHTAENIHPSRRVNIPSRYRPPARANDNDATNVTGLICPVLTCLFLLATILALDIGRRKHSKPRKFRK